MDQRPIITVFGSARPQEGEPAWEEAYAVGRRIAEAGWTLCNGGTSGTMRAAARGAREAGGRTIGITMDIYVGETPNGWLDEEVRVADLFTRLQRLILPASGFVCLRGGCGTLAEWALTWTLLASRIIPTVPLVLLGKEWGDLLAVVREGMISRESDSIGRSSRSPRRSMRRWRSCARKSRRARPDQLSRAAGAIRCATSS